LLPSANDSGSGSYARGPVAGLPVRPEHTQATVNQQVEWNNPPTGMLSRSSLKLNVCPETLEVLAKNGIEVEVLQTEAAVDGERLSVFQFPDLRENTGKFRSGRLSARSRSPVNPRNSIGKSRFPCTVEQGIVQMEQGNFGTSPAGTRQVPQVLRRFKSWARNCLDLQLQKLLATIVPT
jgi:hypothetical protein